jgi:hypothetical protein
LAKRTNYEAAHNIDTINKNTETLIDASKKVGLEVNVEKSQYMLVSRDQNADQIRDIEIGNRSFENVSQFKYLGTTVTNQNLIQEEIKRRLNSGNACYHSVQNLLSSRLLSKNVKVRAYKKTLPFPGFESRLPLYRLAYMPYKAIENIPVAVIKGSRG